jgi:hypothetical protein
MIEPNTKDVLLARKCAIFNCEVNRLIPVDFTFRSDPKKLNKLKEEGERLRLEIINEYPNSPLDEMLSEVEFRGLKATTNSKAISMKLAEVRERNNEQLKSM